MDLLDSTNGYESDENLDAVNDFDTDSEFGLELSISDDPDTSDEEPCSLPKRIRLEADNNPFESSIKAKDGTVWEPVDAESCQNEFSPDVTFSERTGPTEYAKLRITSRLQSFLCLFDNEMFRSITDCTVINARKTNGSWNFSASELMAFVAVLFFRATLCPIGKLVDCWSERYALPSVKETMARDRFKEIMQYLCFDNKDTRTERLKTDKFAAFSDIWQSFIDNCQLCYVPGRHITVDEQLFPTTVSCPFRQYSSSKPDKSGIKFWVAADLKTKYMCNAFPYLGKDPSRPKEERLSDDVVMKLMEPYLGKGRTVTTDNYFTSMTLAYRLLNHNTTLLGTINNIRREFPSLVKDVKGWAKFSTKVYKSGSATLTAYVPRKDEVVCLLSTMHQHVLTTNGPKRKPNTITDYNFLKCGVNIMKQMARMYTVRATTRRWDIAVFYNMLDLAAINAYVLYKACTGSTEGRRNFIHSLAEELREHVLFEKAMKKKPAPLLAPGKKTQCQVQTKCNRNHSTRQCDLCKKYTCRKCKNDDKWVCNQC